jgi:hypothetical protein
MQQLDLSKVPHLKERQEIGALYDTLEAATKAMEAYEEKPEVKAVNKKYDALIEVAEKAHQAAVQKLEDQCEAELNKLGLLPLQQTLSQAEQAVEDWAGKQDDIEVRNHLNNLPQRCALSKLPLFYGDDTLDDNGEDEVLRCFVLPPRTEAEETDDAVEEAA